MRDEQKRESLISWSVDEYTFREKSPDWFWALGIGALAIAVASIIFGNYLFAVLITIGSLTLGLISLRIPKHIECRVTSKGIVVDDTFYPYTTLQSFSVINGEEPKLIIMSSKLFMPLITIPINPEIDEDELEAILSEYLKEGGHHEPLIHTLADRLGF